MKYSGLNLPAHCTLIQEEELSTVSGGGLLSFISYLLSGFRINFGSDGRHDNVDTIVTASGSQSGRGSATVHTNVDTIRSSSYGGWDASFNLGSLFNALVSLFR